MRSGPEPATGDVPAATEKRSVDAKARLSIVVVEVAATVDVVDDGGVASVVVGSASAPLVASSVAWSDTT